MENISFKIHTAITELPKDWDRVAYKNHFLQTPYLKVLYNAAPKNMECFYISIYNKTTLIGVALAQYINLTALNPLGKEKSLLTSVRKFLLQKLASNVLFLGNNMITGQNGYSFKEKEDNKYISYILQQCSKELIAYLKKQKKVVSLVSFKDFYTDKATELQSYYFKNIYKFSVQPNMILNYNNNWKTITDYVASLSKRYRNQYNRARKKSNDIVCKELSYEEIIQHESTIHKLYLAIANKAAFNTFFLEKKHFSVFKKQCGTNFLIFGYFLNDSLVGFHTVLLNGDVLETYFLGYDLSHQKKYMLYLTMLYNMVDFGIQKQCKKIIFGRTALEIKSGVGAVPVDMYGFIYHTNKLINLFIPRVFSKIEPKVKWKQRHPFAK